MELKDLTIEETDIILHASGYSHSGRQYRTHYCCNDADPRLLKLVQYGIFSGPHSSEMLGGMRAMFHLTEFGIDAAQKLYEWRRMP